MFLKKTLIALAFASVLVGCSQQNTTSASQSQSAASTEMQTFSSKAGEISIPKELSRITVLDTNSLNTIQELGASDKIVALPRGTPLPKALSRFSKDQYIDVGTAKEPNLEKIASSQPQLIIMSARMENLIDQIKGIAPTYFNQLDYNDRVNSFK